MKAGRPFHSEVRCGGSGKWRIIADTTRRMTRYFGTSVRFWMNLLGPYHWLRSAIDCSTRSRGSGRSRAPERSSAHTNTAQSHRGSNPCLHLERVNSFIAPGSDRSHGVAFPHLRTATSTTGGTNRVVSGHPGTELLGEMLGLSMGTDGATDRTTSGSAGAASPVS